VAAIRAGVGAVTLAGATDAFLVLAASHQPNTRRAYADVITATEPARSATYH
jgi:hypothetical protein